MQLCWGDRALVRGPPHAASSWGHTAAMGGAARAAALRDTFDIALRLITYNAFHNLNYQ